MDITQLLMYAALSIGILLYAALAVVPLWLEHEAEKADRPVSAQTQPQAQGRVVGQPGLPRLVH